MGVWEAGAQAAALACQQLQSSSQQAQQLTGLLLVGSRFESGASQKAGGPSTWMDGGAEGQAGGNERRLEQRTA